MHVAQYHFSLFSWHPITFRYLNACVMVLLMAFKTHYQLSFVQLCPDPHRAFCICNRYHNVRFFSSLIMALRSFKVGYLVHFNTGSEVLAHQWLTEHECGWVNSLAKSSCKCNSKEPTVMQMYHADVGYSCIAV